MLNLGVLGGWQMIVTDGPAIVELLAHDDVAITSAWPESIGRAVYGPKGNKKGEEAKRFRACIARVMSPETVATLHLPIMVESFSGRVARMVARCSGADGTVGAGAGAHVLWARETREMAFEVATRSIVGTLLSAEDFKYLMGEFNIYSQGVFSPAWNTEKGLPGSAYAKTMQARGRIVEYLRPLLAGAVERYRGGSREAAVMTRLLDAFEEEGVTVEDDNLDELTTQIVFLMFAGTDTSAVSLARVAQLLHENPVWLPRLAAEQDALRARFGETFDRHVMAKSHVARAFVQELFRVSPAVTSTYRKTLAEVTVQGVRVPAGQTLNLIWAPAIKSTHRPGGSPASFNPDQWLADGFFVQNTSELNMTFGKGPRRCLGQALATVEVTVALCMLARQVGSIAMAEEEEHRVIAAVGGHPTGMPVVLRPREAALAGAGAT